MVEVSMKRLLLAPLALVALAAPAAAQYYGSPYSQPYTEEWSEPAPRYQYRPEPEYRYERRPDYGYETRRDYGRDYRYGERRQDSWRRPTRQANSGNVCFTSRGSCEYPQYFPINTPCRCDIPGFGTKRGAILSSSR